MSLVALVLLVFVVLGVFRDGLGRATYILMGAVILGYVTYAYTHPQ
jgi:hypothetical protein